MLRPIIFNPDSDLNKSSLTTYIPRSSTHSTMSSSDSPLPDYVYKLIPSNAPPPDPLPEELALSELDQQSGFIHLSTSIQILGTLDNFFPNDERVYILKIPLGSIKEKIRWESPDTKGAEELILVRYHTNAH